MMSISQVNIHMVTSMMNYGFFAPLPFCSLDDSFPDFFSPWLMRTRTLDDSPSGSFAYWLVYFLVFSPPS